MAVWEAKGLDARWGTGAVEFWVVAALAVAVIAVAMAVAVVVVEHR